MKRTAEGKMARHPSVTENAPILVWIVTYVSNGVRVLLMVVNQEYYILFIALINDTNLC